MQIVPKLRSAHEELRRLRDELTRSYEDQVYPLDRASTGALSLHTGMPYVVKSRCCNIRPLSVGGFVSGFFKDVRSGGWHQRLRAFHPLDEVC